MHLGPNKVSTIVVDDRVFIRWGSTVYQSMHLQVFRLELGGKWFYYCRRRNVYQCGELDKFIETVLEKVESLPVERVAEVLNGFLEQYGSSTLTFII